MMHTCPGASKPSELPRQIARPKEVARPKEDRRVLRGAATRELNIIRKIATAPLHVDNEQLAIEFWTTQVGFKVHREKPMGAQASWIEVGFLL
jgi:hypothetical protein